MKNNRLGFTLIELLATIILLGVVAGITGYAITNLIKSSKEKDLELLISEIKDSIELYYQECKYSKTDSISCSTPTKINGYDSYEITLGTLVEYGFLKGNATDSNGNSTLVNPLDNVNIADCGIRYMYVNGEFDYDPSTDGSCPYIR